MMNKTILLIWFGDYEPCYALPTIEKFKQLNPTWTIDYVRYTTSQLQMYQDIDDPILQLAITNMINKKQSSNDKLVFSFIADEYRDLRIKYADYPIVATDLDVLPISPYDNFFRFENYVSGSVNKYFPYQTTDENGKDWFTTEEGGLVSNCPTTKQPIIISSKINFNKPIIRHFGCLMNPDQQAEWDTRSIKFHNNRLTVEHNGAFILPDFFPIEHYYSWERSKSEIKNNNIL